MKNVQLAVDAVLIGNVLLMAWVSDVPPLIVSIYYKGSKLLSVSIWNDCKKKLQDVPNFVLNAKLFVSSKNVVTGILSPGFNIVFV